MTEPTPEQLNAAEQAGRDTYAAGGNSLDIPHPPRQPLGLRWLRGWLDARDTDQHGPVR